MTMDCFKKYLTGETFILFLLKCYQIFYQQQISYYLIIHRFILSRLLLIFRTLLYYTFVLIQSIQVVIDKRFMYNNVCDYTGFGEKWLSNFNHKRKIQLNERKLTVNINKKLSFLLVFLGKMIFQLNICVQIKLY